MRKESRNSWPEDTIWNKGGREDLLEKVTSEQKLGDQGGSHAKSGERGFQGKGTARAKVLG